MSEPGRDPARASLLVVVFGAAVVAMATSSWTALGLAAAGRFDGRWAIVAGIVAAATFVALVARTVLDRRLSIRLDAEDGMADAACAAVIALAVFRLGPAVPWPAALDGGWYAAAAVRIAHDRSVFFDAPAAAVEGLVTPLATLRSVGIDAPDDRVHGLHAVAFAVPRIGVPLATPYHPPLFAAWAALGVAADGPYGSATAAVWSAALWLLAIAALARANGLRAGAAAATALAALTPEFRVYGATPYAELFAGALALAALVALSAAGAGTRSGARDADAPGPPLDEPGPRRRRRPGDRARLLFTVAGIATGSAVVAKIDLVPFAVLTAAVATAWPAAWRTRGRSAAFVAGACLPAAAFVGLVRGPTSVYTALNGHGVWRLAVAFGSRWGAAAVLVVAGGAAIAGVLRHVAASGHRPRRGPMSIEATPRRWVPWITAGTFVGAALLTVAVWQARSGAAGPTGMVRLLAWSITPLGLFAAAAALAAVVDAARRAPPVVWPLLGASMFVLALPIVTRDLSPIYTARRLAPIAIPAGCLLAALCVERAVDSHGAGRRALVAALAGLALFAAARQSAPLRPSREFAAAQLLIDRLATYARPGDLALFPGAYGGDLTARLAAPLWAFHDVDVAVLPETATGPERGGPGPAAAAIERWSAAHRGGRVLWYAAPTTAPPAGMAVESLGDESLITEAWQPGVLPPSFSTVELTVAVGALTPTGDNSR